MTLDQLATAGTALGVTGLLLAALFGLYRGWWVLGSTYRSKEKEAEEWKQMAIGGLQAAADVAHAARGHTSFSPEDAEMARRIIREAGRGSAE